MSSSRARRELAESGVSADVQWDGWKPCEYVFTSFFLIEILLKVSINGFKAASLRAQSTSTGL